LCGSNVRWKTVPESTASSGESTIARVVVVVVVFVVFVVVAVVNVIIAMRSLHCIDSQRLRYDHT